MKHTAFFFQKLAELIFCNSEKPLSKQQFTARKRELIANPQMQAFAQDVGNHARMEHWKLNVRQAYDAKRKLVEAGKGRNTLAGIPA